MKSLLYCILLLVAAGVATAQTVGVLSTEEIILVETFRKNPEPFRCILGGKDAGRSGLSDHPVCLHSARVGPRDVIDVAISGGTVAFYGKSQAYEPVGFRLTRGETIEVVFRRQNALAETHVLVSYRSDGLHFDVPPQLAGTSSLERGLLVLSEDERWQSNAPIEQNGKIVDWRTVSKADHVRFQIRYVALQR